MKIQQAIIKQGNSLMTKQSIKSLKNLRLVILKHEPEMIWFLHSFSLTLLALFLNDALKVCNKAEMPLVIAALDDRKNKYVVLGIDSPSTKSKRHIFLMFSNFGAIFRDAAERVQAHIKHDSFDASIIEVSYLDLTKFLQSLQYFRPLS